MFRHTPAIGLGFVAAIALSGPAIAAEPEAVVNVFFVDDDAAPGGDGSTWEQAFDTLPQALDESRESLLPAVIYVAGGIYVPPTPKRPGTPADATFELENVERIIGGFTPGQIDPGERDLDDPSARTWLIGDPAAPPRSVVTIPDADHRVYLDALSIVGGSGPGGGGLLIGNADVDVLACGFFQNAGFGSTGGGAIAHAGGTLRATNSVFAGNTSSRGGAYAGQPGTSAAFTHCTFAGNTATTTGGVSETGTFVNCAFLNNVSGDEASDHVGPAGSVSWSIIRGGLPGTGNTTGIVRFVDALGPDGVPWTGDEDYRLGDCSPGTDAASAIALPDTLLTDAAGRPRRVDDLATPDTGEGTGPLPDAGAFESSVTITDAFTARLVGGTWNDGNAWTDGTPDPFTDAVLHGAGESTLATGASAACREFLLTGGALTLDVSAGPLTAGGGTRIGLCGDEPIELTVTGGMLVSPSVTTGPEHQYVLAGDAMIVGDVMNLGTLKPGNLGNGPMHITGDLDQIGTGPNGDVATGRIDVRLKPGDLRGGSGGPEGDARLLVDGMARLAGAIEVSLAEGYYPPAGSQFVLLLANEIEGEFSVAQVPVIDPGVDPRVLTLNYTTIEGRPAVIVDVEASDSIQRYRRSGPGILAGVPGRPTDLTAADIDGDGWLDAVVTIESIDQTDGFVAAYRSLGPGKGGAFTGFEPTPTGPLPVGGRPVAVDTGNFDGGSLPDIIVARRTPGPQDDVVIFFNDNRGDYPNQPGQAIEVGDPDVDDRVSDVAVVDLNAPNAGPAPNLDDFVVVTEATGLVQGFVQANGSTFIPATPRGLDRALVAIDPGKLDDPRKDLLADVAVIGGDDGAVFALSGNGDGTFDEFASFTAGRALRDVRLGSLSGSGTGDDIIISDAQAAAVTVIQNQGAGDFRPPAGTELPEGFERPGVLAITDGENDGDGDVVLVAEESADEDDVDRDALNFRTTINPQDGTVRFEVAEPIGSKPGTRFIVPADVDADGDEDLIIASEIDGDDGSGQLVTIIDVYLNQDPSDIICGPLGDLNCDGFVNDGDLPILLAAWGPCGVGSCPEDLNGSGTVDTVDLLFLLANWTG
ncbi:MAG: hypothetical protein AB8G96_12125 [Phycisphaerales bacterium]